MAELPKDKPLVSSAFLLQKKKEGMMKKIF
jgi:hypothetical protein